GTYPHIEENPLCRAALLGRKLRTGASGNSPLAVALLSAARGCLESPCQPCQPQPLGARHAVRGVAGEPPPPQSAHRQVDHGFTALGEVLIILTQAAVPTDPGDRPCHHPPARQHREGPHGRRLDLHGRPAPAPWAFDALEGPAARGFHPRAPRLPPL